MDLSKIKDLKDLQTLLELMGQYELVELEIEGEGNKIRLRKAEPNGARAVAGFPAVYHPAHPAAPPHPAGDAQGAQGASSGKEAQVAQAASASGGATRPSVKEVLSPMVGTFYRGPSPEAEPFVREGEAVGPDATICIIEAMKVMNEIPAGVSGIVREVLLKNGDPVEFGQPLFRIEAM